MFPVSPKFNISEVVPTETQLSVSPVIPVTTNAEIYISPSRDSPTPMPLEIITNNEVIEYDWSNIPIGEPNWNKSVWSEPYPTSNLQLPAPPAELLTPLQYYKLFVDDSIVEHFVNQTNVYSCQKNGSSINTNFSEMEQYIGIHFYMSIVKMPSYRMFWSSQTRFSIISDNMSRNRYDKLRSNFHVNNNENLLPRDDPNHDKLFKIRPFIDSVRNNMKKVPVEEYSSIDEIIIPFKGRSVMKQYNKN